MDLATRGGGSVGDGGDERGRRVDDNKGSVNGGDEHKSVNGGDAEWSGGGGRRDGDDEDKVKRSGEKTCDKTK